MFPFLRNLFKRKQAPEKPRLVLPQPPAKSTQPAAARPGPGTTPKAKEEWARQAAQKINPGATPEQICGIEAGMTTEQIAAQLAMLYRRHNRAASSLEAHLREEAEIMLDMVAAMRQKYLR